MSERNPGWVYCERCQVLVHPGELERHDCGPEEYRGRLLCRQCRDEARRDWNNYLLQNDVL